MDIRKLQRAIVDGLEDVKGQDIVVFNTEHLSPLFERVIIASGTSNRQTKSLAASVRDAVKAAGGPTPRVEGEGNGEWIIVDCGAAVVHVMQPAFRDYYHLEELWGEKPVRLKLGGPSKVRAASIDARKADDEEAPARAAKKATVRAAKAAKPRVSVGAASRERAPAARKSGAVAKPAPKRGAPAKKAVTRTIGVKSPTGVTAPKPAPSRAGGSPRAASAASATSRGSGRSTTGVKKTAGVKKTTGAKKSPARAATRKG